MKPLSAKNVKFLIDGKEVATAKEGQISVEMPKVEVSTIEIKIYSPSGIAKWTGEVTIDLLPELEKMTVGEEQSITFVKKG